MDQGFAGWNDDDDDDDDDDEKWWFPIGISFSRGLCSGAMLVSGRVRVFFQVFSLMMMMMMMMMMIDD